MWYRFWEKARETVLAAIVWFLSGGGGTHSFSGYQVTSVYVTQGKSQILSLSLAQKGLALSISPSSLIPPNADWVQQCLTWWLQPIFPAPILLGILSAHSAPPPAPQPHSPGFCRRCYLRSYCSLCFFRHCLWLHVKPLPVIVQDSTEQKFFLD